MFNNVKRTSALKQRWQAKAYNTELRLYIHCGLKRKTRKLITTCCMQRRSI